MSKWVHGSENLLGHAAGTSQTRAPGHGRQGCFEASLAGTYDAANITLHSSHQSCSNAMKASIHGSLHHRALLGQAQLD